MTIRLLDISPAAREAQPLQEHGLTTVLTTTPTAGGGQRRSMAAIREFLTDAGGHQR